MKKEKIKRSLILMFLLFIFLLIQVACKQDPCKNVTCQNGGTTAQKDNSCSCNCPAGYGGLSCEVKLDFLTCKINGTDYQSIQIASDTTTNSFRTITTWGDAANSQILQLAFNTSLTTGTYPTTASLDDKFFGRYIKNQANEYYSNRGSLILTNVTGRYEGTFNFTGMQGPHDSVVVTSGSFSVKK